MPLNQIRDGLGCERSALHTKGHHSLLAKINVFCFQHCAVIFAQEDAKARLCFFVLIYLVWQFGTTAQSETKKIC